MGIVGDQNFPAVADLVGKGSLVEGNTGYMLEVVPLVVRYMAVPPVEMGKCIL